MKKSMNSFILGLQSVFSTSLLVLLLSINLVYASSLSDYVEDSSTIKLPITGGDLSGITYNWDKQTFFTVQNNSAIVTEFDHSFSAPLRKFYLKGHKDDDYEGIAYLGNNKFVVVNESNHALIVFIPDSAPSSSVVSTDPSNKSVQEFRLPSPGKNNKGLEGVCYASSLGPNGKLFAVQEKKKRRVYSWDLPLHSTNLNARDDGYFWWQSEITLDLDEPFNAEKTFSGVLMDLSGCYFNDQTGTLYVLSDDSSALAEVSTNGKILSLLKLTGAPQFEGVTMDSNGDLFFVSEPYYLKVYKKK